MSSTLNLTDKRVLLCGYGNAGRILHAPLITATDGLQLAGVVTGDPDRRAQIEATYPAAVIGSSVDEMLAADSYDVVVVASANIAHVAQATAALRAHVPTVVDKPIAPTTDDARALIDLARETGTLLTVFQNRRWDNDFLTLRRLIDDGDLGTVFRLESVHDRFDLQPSDGWRDSGAVGDAGGLLYDVGSHLIDQALVLFGPAKDVYAELDERRPGSEVDDDTFVALTHESGVRSHLTVSLVSAQRRPRFHAHGDRASYVKFGFDPQEDALNAGADPARDAVGTEPEGAWGTVGETSDGVQPVPSVDGSYIEFYRGLVRALNGDGPAPVDAADALHALEVIEAAQLSAAERRVVRIGSDR